MVPYKNFVSRNASIGIFPGAFKPPHIGHFETAKTMADQNKMSYILVSTKERDGITAEKSLAVWSIYKKYLPPNIQIVPITGSPVLIIYQAVDIANNGQFTPTDKVQAPLPEAAKLGSDITQTPAPYEINLYASQEDIDRFKYFFDKEKSSIYKNKNVSSINARDVKRLASATNARTYINSKNVKELEKIIPNISLQDKQKVVNILMS